MTTPEAIRDLVKRLRSLVDDQTGGDALVLVQRQQFNKAVGHLAQAAAALEQVLEAVEEAERVIADAVDVADVTLNMVDGNGAPPDWNWLRGKRASAAEWQRKHGRSEK